MGFRAYIAYIAYNTGRNMTLLWQSSGLIESAIGFKFHMGRLGMSDHILASIEDAHPVLLWLMSLQECRLDSLRGNLKVIGVQRFVQFFIGFHRFL